MKLADDALEGKGRTKELEIAGAFGEEGTQLLALQHVAPLLHAPPHHLRRGGRRQHHIESLHGIFLVASLLFAHLSVPLPFALMIIDGSALSSLPFSCLLLGERG